MQINHYVILIYMQIRFNNNQFLSNLIYDKISCIDGIQKIETLTYLDVSENQLNDLSEDTFNSFQNITQLNMSRNLILFLPNSFGKSENIRYCSD